MEITEKIIDYIKRNQVSTTEVADCLGKQEHCQMYYLSIKDNLRLENKVDICVQ